jgi:hypothetical protein
VTFIFTFFAFNFSDAPAENTDEGTSFGWRNVDNVTALSAAMVNGHPHLSNASVAKLLELYPDDALYGCPYNTGDTRLTSGKMDKRSFSIGGDITMYAGVRNFSLTPRRIARTDAPPQRRLLAQTMSKTHDVFSYRFDQPPDNATVESGSACFSSFPPLPLAHPRSRRTQSRTSRRLRTCSRTRFRRRTRSARGRAAPRSQTT